MFTLIDGLYATSQFQNDHFIGLANGKMYWNNDNDNDERLKCSREKAMTFMWLLCIWLSAPNILSLCDDCISFFFLLREAIKCAVCGMKTVSFVFSPGSLLSVFFLRVDVFDSGCNY